MSEHPDQHPGHQPDHEIEPLEADQSVPPRPEDEVADASREDPGIPLT